MSEETWPKVGAAAGIAAGILFVIGFFVGPSGTPPGFSDSAQEVRSYIQDNHGEIQTSMAIGFAVLFAFTWFLGSVYYRLRPAEQAARLSVVAVAGGILLLVGAVIGSAAETAAAYHVNTLDPNTTLGLWDLSVAGFLFVWVGLAVLTAACAALAIRTKVLPGWLCYYNALAAVYIFVVGLVGTFTETGVFSPYDGALGLIGFIVFIVWLLATGIVLYREPRTLGTAAPGGTPAAQATRPAGGPTAP